MAALIMQFSLPFETTDLRKRPHIEALRTHLPYVRKSPTRMVTADLPIGTQAAFIAAAFAAAGHHKPLNVLLTVRWYSLFSDNDVNTLRPYPAPERIDRLVEHLRKWLVRNDAPPFYIWVRENADSVGEHWHIAFHFPKRRQQVLAQYVEKLTGEAIQRRRNQIEQTVGEFARGELGSWHLARDTRPERRGYYLAAYLGKGEPSQRPFRGKLVDNDKKPVRGVSFGGTYPDGDFDISQGKIEGTARRRDRFFIANELKRVAGMPSKSKTKGPVQSAAQFHSKSDISAKMQLEGKANPKSSGTSNAKIQASGLIM
jgi:hypothetical protein